MATIKKVIDNRAKQSKKTKFFAKDGSVKESVIPEQKTVCGGLHNSVGFSVLGGKELPTAFR